MKETKVVRSADQVNKAKVCEELAGSFHEYADTEKLTKKKNSIKRISREIRKHSKEKSLNNHNKNTRSYWTSCIHY